jgi:hypothetical protein
MERNEVEGILDSLVDEGSMVRFVSRTGAPMWGFPPGPHPHIWGGPKIEDWQREDDSIEVDIRWRCSQPGCGQTASTTVKIGADALPKETA